MATRTLARRVRTAPPEPRIRRLVLTESDYVLFGALARHGPLPSSYLYEFTRHLRRDRSHLQNRLTEFYNGDARGNLLVRPAQQFASYEARYQHLVYDLTPRARALLAERGLHVPFTAHRADPFVHRLMCGCVSASFELGAVEAGVRYIPPDEILGRPGASTARDSANCLALPISNGSGQTLEPDFLFGLEYPSVGYRFFAVECDRNTESIERRNLRQSSIGRKLQAYAASLQTQSYRSFWGVPNLHVLTVTTSAQHAENIVSFIRRDIQSSGWPRFGLAVADAFGANWRVPKGHFPHLLASPWMTAAQQKNLSQP